MPASQPYHLRIARPVSDLDRSRRMYCEGLGWDVLGSFQDHQGFDGVMLGCVGGCHHLEFTRCRTHPVTPQPTPEDLLVIYVPDPAEWSAGCQRMLTAGFRAVASLNPYWELHGRTFEDPDGYRVVIQRAAWVNRVVSTPPSGATP